MRSQIFSSLRRRPLLTALLFLVCAACFIWTTMAVRARENAGKAVTRNEAAVSKARFINSIQMTVSRSGVIPAALEVSEGRYFLVLDSLTGQRDLAFSLYRENGGGKLKEVRMPVSKARWRGVVDLSAGDYVLVEDRRPELKCRLKVVKR